MRGTLKEVRTALVFLLGVAFLMAPFTFPTLPCALPHPRRAWRTDPVRAGQCAPARSSLCAPLLGSAPPAVLPGWKERVRRPGIPHPSQDLLHSPSFPSPVGTESRPGAAGGTQPGRGNWGAVGTARAAATQWAPLFLPRRGGAGPRAPPQWARPPLLRPEPKRRAAPPPPLRSGRSKLSSTGCSRLNCLLYVLLTFI